MVWPQLIGGLEIEERRPRTWNEPRRKRLNFVRDHRRGSGEWALVTGSTGRRHLESQQELWDRRQWEANQRFLMQEDLRIRQQEAWLQQQRERYFLLHPPQRPPPPNGPDPRIQELPPRPPDHHRPGGIEDRHSDHGSHNEPIVAVSSDSGDSDDDYNHRRPLVIEVAPKRASKTKKKHRPASLFSDDSSSDEDFIECFIAGRKASKSRRPSSRGRSRGRIFELSDDSFEDLELRGAARSKSRGPRNSMWVSGGRRK